MNLFQVVQEKCDKCNFCIEACPVGLIEMGDNQIPVPIEGAAEICENCGHCVAVCPHGALSLSTMAPEQLPLTNQDLLPTFEQTEQSFSSRRSIRAFKEKQIEKEVLTKLITAATYSATGMNAQRINWLIYADRDEIQKLAEITSKWMLSFQKTLSPSFLQRIVEQSLKIWDSGNDALCRKAPHLIVAHSSGGTNDCIIALTQLSLAAPALGIGTCWAGWVMAAAKSFPAMQEFLSLPEGHTCNGAMMLGYPKYKYPRIPLRNEAKISWR